jgi:hypothetical protein
MDKEVAIAVVLSIFFFASPVHATAEAGVDITHYDMTVQVTPDEQRFDVSVSVELIPNAGGVTDVRFSFNEELYIDSITSNAGAVEHERRENDMTVSFDSPLTPGEKVLMEFDYYGLANVEPERGESVWGYIGDDGSYMIYESSWYPMIWSDRATAMITMRVPKGQAGITVGTLVDSSARGDYDEFVYEVNNPSRGISFAVGDYKTKTIYYDHIPITVYAYPGDIEGTEIGLKAAEDMLGYYSEVFSEYPYESLKIVEIPDYFMGGHGDQGMIMLYESVFNKDPDMGFLAHEVAHNWWGAQVSAIGEHSLRSGEGFGIFSRKKDNTASVKRDEHNLWLLEGFATYSSMMYTERTDGKEAMIDFINTAKEEYLIKVKTQSDQPIISAEEEYGRTGVFHAVVYSKGALVLHMLRYVVGDETFLSIMDEYAATYEGKSATVGDFQRISEEKSGMSLDWFFDEWLRETTLPDYAVGDVSVTSGEGYTTSFNIVQAGDIAKMPVEVTLYTANSEVKRKVWVDEDKKHLTIKSDSKPLYIEIDSGHWILESDRSNNIHFISYPAGISGIKILLGKITGILS